MNLVTDIKCVKMSLIFSLRGYEVVGNFCWNEVSEVIFFWEQGDELDLEQ